MNRFRFTNKKINLIKKYLKSPSGKKPRLLQRYPDTKFTNNKLIVNDHTVIPHEDVEKFLRKITLSGTVPLTRDGMHYYLQKSKIAGVGRAAVNNFLKKQRIIRETDRAQPVSTKKKRAVKRKGHIGFDLIEINWKDLGFVPSEVTAYEKQQKKDPDFQAKKKKREPPYNHAYIFSAVDKLTGLMWCHFALLKARSVITPLAKKCFLYYKKELKIPIKKLIGYSDKGSEFDFKKYNSWGVRTIQLLREPLIERKNSQFQAALYRIAKMNISKSITDLISRALQVVNRTQSKLLKMAPYEAVEISDQLLAEPYNKKRGKDSGLKNAVARDLKVGDKVRVNLIGPKKTSFFKAYKGDQWSKIRYEILAKKGNKYKINFKNKKTFFHRDNLRLTPNADFHTDQILLKRRKKLQK